jgi:hypothetical protein
MPAVKEKADHIDAEETGTARDEKSHGMYCSISPENPEY